MPMWAQCIRAGGVGDTSERKTKEEATIAVCPCNVSKFSEIF